MAALVGADGGVEEALRDIVVNGFALDVLAIAPAGAALIDRDGAVARRYDLQPGTVVLLRPDAHVCARWRGPSSSIRGIQERCRSSATSS